MICVNSTIDSSNDSAISYSSISLPSSPVRSSAIKDLLESPIIKPNSQTSHTQTNDKNDEININTEVVIVPESPDASQDMTPIGSQEMVQKLDEIPLEVANSQSSEDINTTNSETNSQNFRNCLRRQTSVCISSVGPLSSCITSSPRALAILKNAIKSGINSNMISDKINNNSEEVVKNNSNNNNTNDFIPINGVNSPPNNKLFRNSPLSRGSAFLKAAKERIVKQEIERSPKISYNQVLTESNYDRQLTGILRKHELISSPTSGEPKPKKKKVLFAEPVVSSKLEFKSSPTLNLFEPIEPILTQSVLDMEVEELTTKQNRILVHQNSTFEKEFDSDSQNSNSPLLLTDESETESVLIHNDSQDLVSQSSDTKANSMTMEMESTKKEVADVIDSISSSQSTPEFMCSQVMPETQNFMLSQEDIENSQSVEEESTDPIVMVPLRLSQIKNLYKLFGELIQQYSDS